MRGLVLLGLAACRWTEPPAGPELGWLDDVADHPDRLEALFDATGRDGWIAWHSHRYPDAWDQLRATAPAAAGRAALDEALLYVDLDRLQAEATVALIDAWTALPADSGGRLTAALARRDGPPVDPSSLDASSPDGAARAALWTAAADGDDPGPLTRALAEPWIIEADHRWWDPLGYASLARAWGRRAAPFLTSTDAGLGDLLLGPWLDGPDLALYREAHAPPACAPGWRRCDLADALVGASRAPDRLAGWTGAPDGEGARAEGRRAREALATWTDRLGDRPGGAVVSDLGLTDRLRQRWAVDAARDHLAAGRCEAAQALLEPAMDVTSRGVGPANMPSLLVTLAHARLQCNRTREALDALQPLVEARPEVRAAFEVVADLSVLRGIHRVGDSRED